MRAVVDRFTGKIISRKLLAWIVGTVLCYVGYVQSADWITLTMVYIGSQAAVDLVAKLKS